MEGSKWSMTHHTSTTWIKVSLVIGLACNVVIRSIEDSKLPTLLLLLWIKAKCTWVSFFKWPLPSKLVHYL